jgi:outer membrane protein assembly factor BamB
VACDDPKDGRVVWRTDVFGSAWGRPAVTEKRVYAGVVGTRPYEIRHAGSLAALDRATGQIVWRRPASESPGSLLAGFVAAPAADDLLVIGGLDGTLYAFPSD